MQNIKLKGQNFRFCENCKVIEFVQMMPHYQNIYKIIRVLYAVKLLKFRFDHSFKSIFCPLPPLNLFTFELQNHLAYRL